MSSGDRRSNTVFNHGQLRLYLLQLLSEQSLTGYDIIRLLENRFLGLYTPSTGTVYPRLHRLESDGLIERAKVGSRSVYSIRPAGRDELERRREELEALATEVERRQRELASEVREYIYDRAEETRLQLDTAAAEVRRTQRQGLSDEVFGALGDARENLRQIVRRRRLGARAGVGDGDLAQFERRLAQFNAAALRLAQEAKATPAQLEEAATALDEATARLQRILTGE